MKYFKNITKQDITEKIGGKEIIIKAGEAIKLEDFYANKIAIAAAQRELFAQKYDEEQQSLLEGKKVSGIAISQKIIENLSQKFLTAVKDDTVVSIEDLEEIVEEKPKKTSKKKVVIEEENQEIDDSDFVDQE